MPDLSRPTLAELRARVLDARAQEERPRGTLCLNMIVKDEAHGIVATLESARDIAGIDYWVILDTGSTDGTQELIRETLRYIPGELHSGEFSDYASTRNAALELCGNAPCEWVLLLSGDEKVTSFTKELLADSKYENAAGFDVQLDYGDQTTHRPARVVRPGIGWHYEGVTHEAFEAPPEGKLAGPQAGSIYHEPDPPETKRARWELDRQLLEKECEAHPQNARARFYLGQTYACLGEDQKAIDAYIARSQMAEGWHEERFEAMLRAGAIASFRNASREAVERLLLAAHLLSQHRAEPLLELAKFYRKGAAPQWHSAYHFACEASLREFPQHDRLFVDRAVYDWRALDERAVAAFYLEQFDEAINLNRALLEGGFLPDAQRSRIEGNIAQAQKLAAPIAAPLAQAS